MHHINSAHKTLWLATTLLALTLSATAQTQQLGRVVFPNFGSSQAQDEFLRGLAALHSFWYEEALEAFQNAAKADPGFALANWGEAMTYNHPIWMQQDYEAGRKALAKIPADAKLTPREKAFIEAARVLYGTGDKLARDLAYAAAMEKLYRDYPDDLETAAFYSLSLLGTVRPGEKGFQRQMKAGAIALEVYQKNPNHPGAAHYIIHAFDDPEHAILALPAARRYAEIAPAAHHAQHMPSHIFVQLGMWPEAAASNETAWRVSTEWVERKKLAFSQRDYHSYHWLTYVYCQQGRYNQAAEMLNRLRQTVQEHGGALASLYETLAATYTVETGQWNQAAPLLAAVRAGAQAEPAGHAGHGAAPAGQMSQNPRELFSPLFVRALAAASTGSAESEKLLGELRAARQQGLTGYNAKVMEVRELEVAAMLSASKKNFEEAIVAMKRAAALEEEMSPPSGPPVLLKPAHELFGEILLSAGKPKEAVDAFIVALARQPNRARSLLGLARAYAQSGDKARATTAYNNFLQQWRAADADLPEAREARGFTGQTGGQ